MLSGRIRRTVIGPGARGSMSFLFSLPTDHGSGQPYVMWKGTPYAHIMPVGEVSAPADARGAGRRL